MVEPVASSLILHEMDEVLCFGRGKCIIGAYVLQIVQNLAGVVALF